MNEAKPRNVGPTLVQPPQNIGTQRMLPGASLRRTYKGAATHGKAVFKTTGLRRRLSVLGLLLETAFHIARAPRSWVYASRTNIPYPRKSKKRRRDVKILTPRACLEAKKTLTLHPQNRPGKDAGVVDRGGLENRCALTGTQGSNPCLSANRRLQVNNLQPSTI